MAPSKLSYKALLKLSYVAPSKLSYEAPSQGYKKFRLGFLLVYNSYGVAVMDFEALSLSINVVVNNVSPQKVINK